MTKPEKSQEVTGQITTKREWLVEAFRRWGTDAAANPKDYEKRESVDDEAEASAQHLTHLLDVIAQEHSNPAAVTDAGENDAEEGLLAGD